MSNFEDGHGAKSADSGIWTFVGLTPYKRPHWSAQKYRESYWLCEIPITCRVNLEYTHQILREKT
jgi:hypothetical protein